MIHSRFTQWEMEQQQLLQKRLEASCEFLVNEYAYDFSNICFLVNCIEFTESDNVDLAILKHTLTLADQDRKLLTLEFTRIREEFEDALWNPETTDYVPCGIAIVLSRVSIEPKLNHHEIKALTHASVLLNLYGLVVCEESEMRRQPSAFQETWQLYWKDGKPVEDRGIRYLRFDDPFGWNAS
ncbi:hypothetical protein CIG75_14855 [Tumebacillus algifaecis]|uniref:Uncharacterized protein n=1 Tax=Tumebacillus algifaecis TaxID=1214604 RepID=A0A223D3H2_9BACL|nr:hypothetical protein [Tumebacillus algifaecis]ASS76110.1 hypothetical protein CIG75_14855 [Tumebacillus algifaecis]